jgi:hypothetical protein
MEEKKNKIKDCKIKGSRVMEAQGTILKINGHPIYNNSLLPLKEANHGGAEFNYVAKPNILVLLFDNDNRYIHLLIYDETEIYEYSPLMRASRYRFMVYYFSEPQIFKLGSRNDLLVIYNLIKHAKEYNTKSSGLKVDFRVTDKYNVHYPAGIPESYLGLMVGFKTPIRVLLDKCKTENINVCNERNFYTLLAYERLTHDGLRIEALANAQILTLLETEENTLRALLNQVTRSRYQPGNIKQYPAADLSTLQLVMPLFPYERAIVYILKSTKTCPDPELNCSLYGLFLLKFIASIARDTTYTISQILTYLSNIVNILDQSDILTLAKILFSAKANIFPVGQRIPNSYQYQIAALIVDALDKENFDLLFNSFFTDMQKYKASKILLNAHDRLFELFLQLVNYDEREEYKNEYQALKDLTQLGI